MKSLRFSKENILEHFVLFKKCLSKLVSEKQMRITLPANFITFA